MIPSRLVADERERASGVGDELGKLGVRVYFTRLVTGDYVLSPEIAVERKSLGDLISSIYDGRLFQQAAKLSHSFTKPYLLIEGDSTQVEEKVPNLKSYYGALANVTLAYGLRVVYTANQRETAVALAELLTHARAKPLREIPPQAVKKPQSLSDQQLFVVSSLPGVGRKLAEKLLRKYETPRRVMSLTAGELAMTPGLGWRKAEGIRKAMDVKFSRAREAEDQTRLHE